PIMTRLSLKVRWWQLGQDNDVSFIGYPQLESKLTEIKRNLEQYGQQIKLGINWRWNYTPPKAAGPRAAWAYLCYGIEPPLTAEETAAYLSVPPAASERAPVPTATAYAPSAKAAPSAARRTAAGPRRWIQIAPLARSEYTAEVRVHDLVQ